jgi:hypothetical protein
VKKIIFLILSLFSLSLLHAQVEVLDDLLEESEIRLYKQRSIFGGFHTNGFELGFRWGKMPTIKRYVFQEVEFTQLKHYKFTYRRGVSVNFFSRNFMYGVLNEAYSLRYGWGMASIITEKPFWGGVSTSWFFAGGAELLLAIPQYLNVWYPVDSVATTDGWQFRYATRVEKYDPNNPQHADGQFIEGRGPYFKGVLNLRPYPGIYAKAGFSFEFGKYQERLHQVEIGAMVDFFPIPVSMMAHLPKTWWMLNGYITYHFGWRK